jgi:ATP-dependent DNA ligase
VLVGLGDGDFEPVADRLPPPPAFTQASRSRPRTPLTDHLNARLGPDGTAVAVTDARALGLDPGWRLAFEVKWDGFRTLVSRNGNFRVWSRRGWVGRPL